MFKERRAKVPRNDLLSKSIYNEIIEYDWLDVSQIEAEDLSNRIADALERLFKIEPKR
jgi:hypothetical protein